MRRQFEQRGRTGLHDIAFHADHPVHARFGANKWPTEVPEFGATYDQLYRQLDGLGASLLELALGSLGAVRAVSERHPNVFGTLLGAPFNAADWVRPLSTDLSAWQLIELGWVKLRTSTGNALHCRLGGDFGGGGTGTPSEDNPLTILMFLGKSAPQPPATTFGPGCARGRTLS